jgi:5'/3'-nucleotidase SurE
LEQRPDFVVSGVNNGQNMSTSVILVSGTIGAARRSAVNGIPSIAVSFSIGDNSDYTPAVQALLAWFTENAPRRITDAAEAGLTGFTNMNVANCPSIGKVNLGPVAVEPGELGDRDYGAFTCDGAPNPADDIAAYQAGYIAISELPLPA